MPKVNKEYEAGSGEREKDDGIMPALLNIFLRFKTKSVYILDCLLT